MIESRRVSLKSIESDPIDSPELGRYITSDPIGLFGGVNTFGYVGGEPVGNVDESGLVQIHFPSEINLEEELKNLPDKKGNINIGKLKRNLKPIARRFDSLMHHDPDFLKSIPGKLIIKPKTSGINIDGIEIQYSCPIPTNF